MPLKLLLKPFHRHSLSLTQQQLAPGQQHSPSAEKSWQGSRACFQLFSLDQRWLSRAEPGTNHSPDNQG